MEQNQQPPVFNPGPQGQQPAPKYQPQVNALPMLEPVTAVKTCLKKYLDFTGRARRSEYWWFILFTTVISWIFSFLGGFMPWLSYVGVLISLVLCIPTFAAMTRRLHDTNRSGWWVFLLALAVLLFYGALCYMLYPHAQELMQTGDDMMLAETMVDAIQSSSTSATVMIISGLVATVVTLITLIFCILDSKVETNKYGPSPKYK